MNNLLKDFCRNNDLSSVKEILNASNSLDVLTNNGDCFRFAISKKNTEICRALLEYFENKQFTVKNNLYENAKEKLIEILENAIEGIDISSEMQDALRPYINFDNSFEDRLNDSLLEEITLPFENNDLNRQDEMHTAGEGSTHTHNNPEILSN